MKNTEDFVREFKSLEEGLQLLSSKVEKKLSYLQVVEKQLEEANESMDANIAKTKEKIKLDIGGKLFTTAKSTLLSVPGTYFYAMLSSGKWLPDENGNVVSDTNIDQQEFTSSIEIQNTLTESLTF